MSRLQASSNVTGERGELLVVLPVGKIVNYIILFFFLREWAVALVFRSIVVFFAYQALDKQTEKLVMNLVRRERNLR